MIPERGGKIAARSPDQKIIFLRGRKKRGKRITDLGARQVDSWGVGYVERQCRRRIKKENCGASQPTKAGNAPSQRFSGAKKVAPRDKIELAKRVASESYTLTTKRPSREVSSK